MILAIVNDIARHKEYITYSKYVMWLGNVMVSPSDLQLTGCEFVRCWVTTLGKLFTCASDTKQYNLLKGKKGKATTIYIAA